MPETEPKPTPNVQSGLLINRLLYEGRGDELLEVVRNLVLSGDLKLSKEPVHRLLETVNATLDGARAPKAGCDARE